MLGIIMLSICGLFVLFFTKNGPIHLFLTILIIGGVAFKSYYIAENNIGAQSLEHEDGVSLRQDSNTVGTRSLFIYYNKRSHMGGGLAGGK